MDDLSHKNRWLLLSPSVVAISLFFICPLLIILAYSFMVPGRYGGIIWEFSFEAYIQFLFDRDFDGNLVFNTSYLQIFFRSFKLAFITILLCLLIAFPMAYYMATRPVEKRNLWIFLITIPFWTNLLIRTYAWMLILRDQGLVNGLFQWLHITDKPVQMLYTDFSIGLGLVYSYLPFMVLPIFVALERMDWKLVEAAHDLYASKVTILRRIIIPLSAPGIFAGSILVFIPALGSFLAPDLLGGGKSLMIGNLVQLQFTASRNWPFGSAASMILMVFVLLGLLFLIKKGRSNKGVIH